MPQSELPLSSTFPRFTRLDQSAVRTRLRWTIIRFQRVLIDNNFLRNDRDKCRYMWGKVDETGLFEWEHTLQSDVPVFPNMLHAPTWADVVIYDSNIPINSTYATGYHV